jgi:hypothetical protein
MASIDHTNFELLTVLEREYARVLRMVVTEIFDHDAEVADSFERELGDSPARERLLALHESPLEVAAALTGRPINLLMRSRYETLLTSARLEDSPEEFEEAEGSPERPPVAFIEYLLNLLGYEPIHGIDDKIVVWKLSTSLLSIEDMRSIVLTPMLTAKRYKEVTVSKRTVLEFLSYVFQRRLPDSSVELILKALLSARDRH